MDINEKFDPDRVYYAVVWRHAPWWVIEVEPVGVTQTYWWADAEYMARDLMDCMFELDDPSAIQLEVVRGIGPVEYPPARSPRTWFWAVVGGVREYYARRRREHGPLRLWFLGRGNWLGPNSLTDKPVPLVFRGGDEYGNRTIAVRLPRGALLVLATAVRLRRDLLDPTAFPEPEPNR